MKLKTWITLIGIVSGASLVLLQAMLIAHKLIGLITVSWWLVMMPTLITVGSIAFVTITYMTLIAIIRAHAEEEMRDMN